MIAPQDKKKLIEEVRVLAKAVEDQKKVNDELKGLVQQKKDLTAKLHVLKQEETELVTQLNDSD